MWLRSHALACHRAFHARYSGHLFARSGDTCLHAGEPVVCRAPVRFSQTNHGSTEPSIVSNTASASGGKYAMSNAVVMGLLEAQVPLSLLYDLWDPKGHSLRRSWPSRRDARRSA